MTPSHSASHTPRAAATPPADAGNADRPLEMWGGLECTVARIGDEFIDQTRLNGHEQRGQDLDRFAGLGIKAIRYPVLWERIEPSGSAPWGLALDGPTARAHERAGAAAIACHPPAPRQRSADTELTAPDFVQKFVAFATRVERYPWLDAYTPINEPLTTARFCGLYGLMVPARP